MTSQTPLTTVLPPNTTLTLDLGAPTGTYSSAPFTQFAQNATVTSTDASVKIQGLQVRMTSGGGNLSFVSGGALDTDGNGTLGNIDFSYNSTTKLLRLSDNTSGQTATAADFQAALRSVAISNASGEVKISANLGKPVYRSENGNYYEFVRAGDPQGNLITWTAANTAATSSNFLGLTGYLATITSQAENQFLTSIFDSRGWIGGQVTAANQGTRKWTWTGGPEAGKSFWIGDANGSSTGADLSYSNWDASEPNNFVLSSDPRGANGESYAQFTTGGKWNDLANDPSYQGTSPYRPEGYWIEYDDGVLTTDPLAATRDLVTLTAAGTNPQLDLVFYDPTRGQVSFGFTSNGYNIATNTTAADSPALTINSSGATPSYTSAWRIVSANVDVDKDNIKDVIVANNFDNSVVVFFGEARTGSGRQFAYTRSGYVTNATGQIFRPGTDWTLDFASDKIGANDAPGLFWRSKQGVSAIWTINQPVTTASGVTNVTITSSGAIFTAGPNSGWRAMGDGEFNANAATREVFWVNDNDGKVVTWTLAANRSLVSGKLAWTGVAPTSIYRVAGIGNVNGTGNDEIVWQAGSAAVVWNMADGAYLAAGSSGAITLTTGDRIKVLADIDNDGTLDFVGQNDTNGSIGAYALTSTYAFKNTTPRTQYTSGTGTGAYNPAKGGPGASTLELVNVAQYGV